MKSENYLILLNYFIFYSNHSNLLIFDLILPEGINYAQPINPPLGVHNCPLRTHLNLRTPP